MTRLSNSNMTSLEQDLWVVLNLEAGYDQVIQFDPERMREETQHYIRTYEDRKRRITQHPEYPKNRKDLLEIILGIIDRQLETEVEPHCTTCQHNAEENLMIEFFSAWNNNKLTGEGLTNKDYASADGLERREVWKKSGEIVCKKIGRKSSEDPLYICPGYTPNIIAVKEFEEFQKSQELMMVDWRELRKKYAHEYELLSNTPQKPQRI
jgi:hypothetical protein